MFTYPRALCRCPELNACISSTLWCDNVQHCPSGFDENDINCLQFTMPALYIGLGGGLLILLTVLILCTSWCKYRQHRKTARQAEKQTVRGNLHGNNISHNGDIYCQRYSVNSSDLYLDRKDSLCWQNISPLETTVWSLAILYLYIYIYIFCYFIVISMRAWMCVCIRL